jgi:hypothetical protein
MRMPLHTKRVAASVFLQKVFDNLVTGDQSIQLEKGYAYAMHRTQCSIPKVPYKLEGIVRTIDCSLTDSRGSNCKDSEMAARIGARLQK